MRKTVRRIALLLALLMVIASFAACSPKTPDDGTGSGNLGNNPEDSKYDPGLPDADFNDYTFTIAGRGDEAALDGYSAKDMVADGSEGDVVSQAVYKRNMELKQKYNFNVEVEYLGGVWGKLAGSQMYKNVEQFVNNNDDFYDIIISATQETIGFSMQGWTVDLNTVPNLNLTKEWWDQSVARDLAIGQKLFMATGDIMTSDERGVLCVAFNKKLAGEYAELGDHYEIVKTQQWTLEKFYANSRLVASDIGNDGLDENDRYGFVFWRDSMMSFINGTGHAIGTAKYGTFEITADSLSMQRMWTEMMDFLNSDAAHSIYLNDAIWSGSPAKAQKHFLETNNALYLFATAAGVATMRDYNAEFGILPNPKLNESQENYITAVSPWGVNFVSIPVTNVELSRTGHILEALAAKGSQYVKPAFYEVTLKTKGAPDHQSSEMLDFLFSTRYYDLGNCFSWGELAGDVLELFDRGGIELSSTVRKKRPAAEADMEAQMILFGMK